MTAMMPFELSFSRPSHKEANILGSPNCIPRTASAYKLYFMEFVFVFVFCFEFVHSAIMTMERGISSSGKHDRWSELVRDVQVLKQQQSLSCLSCLFWKAYSDYESKSRVQRIVHIDENKRTSHKLGFNLMCRVGANTIRRGQRWKRRFYVFFREPVSYK